MVGKDNRADLSFVLPFFFYFPCLFRLLFSSLRESGNWCPTLPRRQGKTAPCHGRNREGPTPPDVNVCRAPCSMDRARQAADPASRCTGVYCCGEGRFVHDRTVARSLSIGLGNCTGNSSNRLRSGLDWERGSHVQHASTPQRVKCA